MSFNPPSLLGESSRSVRSEENRLKIFTPENDLDINKNWDCFICIPEDCSDSEQNMENANSSATGTETEHHVSNGIESNLDRNQSFANLEEDLECNIQLNNPDIKLEVDHYECKFDIKLRRGWPRSLKSLRFYQFCDIDNLITYIKGKEKILQRWYFYGNDFNSNPICGDPVLDTPHEHSSKILFYTEIDEIRYNETGCFQFSDKPKGMWPLSNPDSPDYRLSEIMKKQDFHVYIVAVSENDEEVPMKCWNWGYTFKWDQGKGDQHFPKKPELVDLARFPFPNNLRKLPNANNRQFLYQFPNPSAGIPANVVNVNEFPKVLPASIKSGEEFKEIIIESLRDTVI